jgi:hypothetical protein
MIIIYIKINRYPHNIQKNEQISNTEILNPFFLSLHDSKLQLLDQRSNR